MNQNINDFSNFDYSNLSNFLKKLDPNEFTAIGCLCGFLIANVLNNNQQNTIGNFLELVGQVILTIQAKSSVQTNYATTSNLQDLEERINKKLTEIYNLIKKLKN